MNVISRKKGKHSVEPCRGNLLTGVTAVQCCAVVLYFGGLPRHRYTQLHASFLVMTASITLLRHCEAFRQLANWRGNLLTGVTAVQCCAVVLYFGRLPRHGYTQLHASFLVMTASITLLRHCEPFRQLADCRGNLLTVDVQFNVVLW